VSDLSAINDAFLLGVSTVISATSAGVSDLAPDDMDFDRIDTDGSTCTVAGSCNNTRTVQRNGTKRNSMNKKRNKNSNTW